MSDIKFGLYNNRVQHRFIHLPLSRLAYHDFMIRDAPLRQSFPGESDSKLDLFMDVPLAMMMHPYFLPALNQPQKRTRISVRTEVPNYSCSYDSFRWGMRERARSQKVAAEEAKHCSLNKMQSADSSSPTTKNSGTTIAEAAKKKRRRRSLVAPELAAIMKEFPVRMPQRTHRLGFRPISGPFGRAKAKSMAELEAQLKAQLKAEGKAAAKRQAAKKAVLVIAPPKAKASYYGANGTLAKREDVMSPATSTWSSDSSVITKTRSIIGDSPDIRGKGWNSAWGDEGAGDAAKEKTSKNTGVRGRPKTAVPRIAAAAAANGKLAKEDAAKKIQSEAPAKHTPSVTWKETDEISSWKTQVPPTKPPTGPLKLSKAKSLAISEGELKQSAERHPMELRARSDINTRVRHHTVHPTLHQLILASAISMLGGPPCERNHHHNPRLPSFWDIL